MTDEINGDEPLAASGADASMPAEGPVPSEGVGEFPAEPASAGQPDSEAARQPAEEPQASEPASGGQSAEPLSSAEPAFEEPSAEEPEAGEAPEVEEPPAPGSDTAPMEPLEAPEPVEERTHSVAQSGPNSSLPHSSTHVHAPALGSTRNLEPLNAEEISRIAARSTAASISTAPASSVKRKSKRARRKGGGREQRVREDERIPDGNRKRRRKRRRVLLIVLIVIVILLVAAYAAGAYAFSQVYYPNTSIMGVDVSLETEEEASSGLATATEDYSLTVSCGSDFSWTYDASEEDFAIDVDEVAQSVLEGNEPLKWPLRLYEAMTEDGSEAYVPDEDTGYPVEYDESAFKKSLNEAIETYNAQRSGTFDAESAYDAEEGAFTVSQALGNRHLKSKSTVALAENALVNLESDVVLGEEAYATFAGGASDEELQTACDAANLALSTDLTLTMGGTEIGTLDGETVRPWLVFSKKLALSADEDELTAWAQELADSVCTVGSTRTLEGSAGGKVKVSGGTYGWEIDVADLVSALQDAVSQGQTGELDVPTSSSGARYSGVGERDWGAYAEVDISEQHAWYYDADGELLWEAGVITGNPNKGNDTPTGVYKVNAKYTDITLTGDIDPDTGEPSYESPVKYWMAFVGGSVGFHDATWQSAANFSNKEAYLTVGSHGCVNLSLKSAKKLYDVIEVGDCVIVHK